MQHVRVYILMIGLAAFNIMYLTVDFTSAFNFLHVSVLQLHCLKLNLLFFYCCTVHVAIIVVYSNSCTYIHFKTPTHINI
jgi:hypothetical protein